MKTVIITGITGQAGSYFSELLLEKDYKVIGIQRRSSTNTTERISHLLDNQNFSLIEGDLTDPASISGIINEYKPGLCVNFAAQSHVATSFEQPTTTFEVDTIGVLNLLESIRRYSTKTKFIQSSTSEMFGDNCSYKYNTPNGIIVSPCMVFNGSWGDSEWIQDENTTFNPQSPYAIAKLAAHHLVGLYRKSYNLHASCAIMFNYESLRRGEKFVTRKITKWIAEYKQWAESQLSLGATLSYWDNNRITAWILDKAKDFPKLRLGNLDAVRDWGHCKDTMRAVYLMSQQDEPDDYVISTGSSHTVREFLDLAFKQIGIEDWSNYVVIDEKFYRPSEVEFLRGDFSKARRVLGWSPEVTFEELVKEMVSADIRRLDKCMVKN